MQQSPNPEIKPMSSLRVGMDKAPTIETWSEFKDENMHAITSGGYLDGTYDMLARLETIVAIKDFNEMR